MVFILYDAITVVGEFFPFTHFFIHLVFSCIDFPPIQPHFVALPIHFVQNKVAMLILLKRAIDPAFSLKFFVLKSSFINPFIINRYHYTTSLFLFQYLDIVLQVGYFLIFVIECSFQRITVFPFANEFELVSELNVSVEKSIKRRGVEFTFVLSPIFVLQYSFDDACFLVHSLIVSSIR